MNKEFAKQKTIEAFKEECKNYEEWEKAGYTFKDDFRKYGKIINWKADDKYIDSNGKTIKCNPFCILFFDTGKRYELSFEKNVSYYGDLVK